MPLRHFHPTIQRWFTERVGAPSPPQEEGWPRIRSGRHTLIAAPTGTGKTLAAFLWAIDELLRQGAELRDTTAVLYVSPLKALGNDVQKNLSRPLVELRAMDPSLPEVRVLVRTGDTPQHERAAMLKRPRGAKRRSSRGSLRGFTGAGSASQLRIRRALSERTEKTASAPTTFSAPRERESSRSVQRA